ncbi:glycosyltransferase [Lactococcus lactis]|uniref:glycosyltransferase n=1 Tax=Lactococcus lactis TaxID=1358 RepID=UPI00384F25AA
MATYNGAEKILPQLYSFLSQSILPDKVYILDDCSTDTTLQVIEQFIEKNLSDIEWIIKKNIENIGWRETFFKLIKTSNYNDNDIIFFSDQDDIWNNSKIELSSRVIREDAQIDLLVSDYDKILPEDIFSLSSEGQVDYDFKIEKYSYKLLDLVVGPGCVMAFRGKFGHEIANQVQSIGQMAHDALLSNCALAKGTCYHLPVSLIKQVRYETSVYMQKSSIFDIDFNKKKGTFDLAILYQTMAKKFAKKDSKEFIYIDKKLKAYKSRKKAYELGAIPRIIFNLVIYFPMYRNNGDRFTELSSFFKK